MTKKSKKAKKGTRTAPAKLVTLKKAPASTKGSGKKALLSGGLSAETPSGVRAEDASPGTGLARISQLETERTNLMAQVAWARGVAQEQQKALEVERQRAETLAADLETQRARVEQLKALGVLDRILGRHKRI